MVVYYQNLGKYAPQFGDNAITFKDKNFFYKFSSLGGIFHISAKLQGGYLQNVMLTNRKI